MTQEGPLVINADYIDTEIGRHVAEPSGLRDDLDVERFGGLGADQAE
jgi:hypothetical protein